MIFVAPTKESKWFPVLSKRDLLGILEDAVPQNRWPPRPTRQDADTIREIVRQASMNGHCGPQVRAAVSKRIAEKRAAGGRG